MSSIVSRAQGIALACSVALWPVPLFAQTCDYQVVGASWSAHPKPDSIFVNFAANVDGPAGPDAAHPAEYDMLVSITFNGAPLDVEQQLHLSWWQGYASCTSACAPNLCSEKAWTFKGGEVRDHSNCTRDAQNACGCPPIGDPVIEHKAVKKPSGPGIIEVELVPLSLQSCNPIHPENDSRQFPYPGDGGSVPGWPRGGAALLVSALGVASAITLSRRAARTCG